MCKNKRTTSGFLQSFWPILALLQFLITWVARSVINLKFLNCKDNVFTDNYIRAIYLKAVRDVIWNVLLYKIKIVFFRVLQLDTVTDFRLWYKVVSTDSTQTYIRMGAGPFKEGMVFVPYKIENTISIKHTERCIMHLVFSTSVWKKAWLPLVITLHTFSTRDLKYCPAVLFSTACQFWHLSRKWKLTLNSFIPFICNII